MVSNIYQEYPAEHWCFSWWHKVRYGSYLRENRPTKYITVQEYFCHKCGKKTEGFTHYKWSELDY